MERVRLILRMFLMCTAAWITFNPPLVWPQVQEVSSESLLIETHDLIKIIDAGIVDTNIIDYGRSRIGYYIGHIPGATNLEWLLNLDNDYVFLLQPHLNELYLDHGIVRDRQIVAYCQIGVRASHVYFALRLLGFDKVRVYDGSWQEWGNDLQTPLVQGSSP